MKKIRLVSIKDFCDLDINLIITNDAEENDFLTADNFYDVLSDLDKFEQRIEIYFGYETNFNNQFF